MEVHNSYKELPIVPYQNIVLPVQDAIDCLNDFKDFKNVVLKIALAVSYNETAGFKSIVGGNLNGILRYNAAGFQSDSGRWKNVENVPFCATTIMNEHMTGNARGFLLFDTLSDSLYMLAYELNARGIYLGAKNVNSVEDLATKYWQKWVEGDNSVMPESEMNDFVKTYNYCSKLI